MKLIKSDYKILHSNERTMLIKLIVPYYRIMELQSMGKYLSFDMLPINNSNEGISFILPKDYSGQSNDITNISSGAAFLLAALEEIERHYLSIIYAPGVKIDRNDKDYILPMCTAYEVTMECKKEMFDKIIELC